MKMKRKWENISHPSQTYALRERGDRGIVLAADLMHRVRVLGEASCDPVVTWDNWSAIHIAHN